MNIERWMHKHPNIVVAYVTGYCIYVVFSMMYRVKIQIKVTNGPPKLFRGVLAQSLDLAQNLILGFFYWPFLVASVIKQNLKGK